MLDRQQQDYLDRFTSTVQIITGALALGIVVYAIVVLLMEPEQAEADEARFISLMAAGAAVMAWFLSIVVPRLLRTSMRQSIADGNFSVTNIPSAATELGDFGSLASMYQATLIINLAILEAAAFFNLMAYMLEHQTINLFFAAGLLFAIFVKFPTRRAVESWINDELGILEELRAFKK